MNSNLPPNFFPQPENPEIPLWHYMDLAKFILLLDKREIGLVRVDKMADIHEGTLPKGVARNLEEGRNRVGMSPEDDNFPKIRKNARRQVYVSCWHMSEHESEAMWQLYCPNRQGVAIKTSYSALAKVAAQPGLDVKIGVVRYLDYENEVWEGGWQHIHAAHMHKRIAFVHEKEVRLLHVDLTPYAERDDGFDNRPVVHGVACDLSQVVQGIHINPYSSGWFTGVVKAVVNKFDSTLVSLIKQSIMSQDPQY